VRVQDRIRGKKNRKGDADCRNLRKSRRVGERREEEGEWCVRSDRIEL